MSAIDDPHAFRRALGAFPTGVTVVTTRERNGTPRGFTANSFTSVSLDPPLILVCIAKPAASCDVFAEAEGFAVTVLAHVQQDVSALFASKAADKFARAPWSGAALGLPVIDGGAAWFACARERTIDAGDHLILLGRVLEYNATPREPLGYCRGAYVDFALSQKAVAAIGRAVRVEALLERADQLLFVRRDDGTLSLPSGASLGQATDPYSLWGVLAVLGVRAHLDFLFAVFERPGTAAMHIVYRGSFDGDTAHLAVELHRLDSVPLDRVADVAVRSMIARYFRERVDGFGIYVGDENDGTVQRLGQETAA